MPERETDFLTLAFAVADKNEVEWDQELSNLDENADVQLVHALQQIRDISTFHDQLQSDSMPEAAETGNWAWGHLRLLEPIGRGAFGDVYRAHDEKLDRQVALKLLRAGNKDPRATSRMIQEGRLMARVDHRNVVQVYGVDHFDGRVGLWMELINGQTLSELLRHQGVLAAHEATVVGLDLCNALAAVHSRGIVHRDIKAQNVMRRQGGRITLMDFGVGVDRGNSAVEQGSISGTPLYLAPEVLAGHPASVSSDIYSLGVLLFHLVSGAFPYTGESLIELRQAHLANRNQLLRDLRPGLPDTFVQAIEGALEPDPTRRYASAGEMERALREVLGGRAERGQYAQRFLLPSLLVLILVAAFWLSPGQMRKAASPSQSSAEASNPESDENEAGGRDWMVLAEFIDHSQEDLDPAFRELLALALEPSEIVRVHPATVSSKKFRWLVQGESRLDEATGLVTLRLELKELEAGDSAKSLSMEQEAQTPDDVMGAVDALAKDLRVATGESQFSLSGTPLLEEVVTGNLDAFRLFSRGLAAYNGTRQEDTDPAALLKSAVREDPEFAIAYHWLAVMLHGRGYFEEAAQNATKAYELRARLSERWQHLVMARYHVERLEYRLARDAYFLALTIHADDDYARRQIAHIHDRRFELGKAVEQIRLSVGTNPGNIINHGMLAILLVEQGLPRDGLDAIAGARSNALSDNSYLYWGEGLAFLVLDEPAKALTAFRNLTGSKDDLLASLGEIQQAQTKIYTGHFKQAQRLLEHNLGQDADRGFRINQGSRRLRLATLHRFSGDKDEAARHLQELAKWKALPIYLRFMRRAALEALKLGRLELAQTFLEQIRLLDSESDSRYISGVRGQVEAEILMTKGLLKEALSTLKSASEQLKDPLTLQSFLKLHMRAEQWSEALENADEMLQRKGWILRHEGSNLWVLAHLKRARILRSLEQTDEAVTAYKEFLRLWKDADPGIEAVAEARAELADLTTASLPATTTRAAKP